MGTDWIRLRIAAVRFGGVVSILLPLAHNILKAESAKVGAESDANQQIGHAERP